MSDLAAPFVVFHYSGRPTANDRLATYYAIPLTKRYYVMWLNDFWPTDNFPLPHYDN